MSNVYDGGPAFPALSRSEVYDNRDGEKHVAHETVGGMSLRAYFMAHAPAEPQPWFRPAVVREIPPQTAIILDKTDAERHELEGWREGMYSAAYLQEPRARQYAMGQEAWEKVASTLAAENEKQRYLQWPAAWADAQLAILKVQP